MEPNNDENFYDQFFKKYVLVTYKDDEGHTRRWEGCLHEQGAEFIFVAGKFSMPIRKDSITSIEITREEQNGRSTTRT